MRRRTRCAAVASILLVLAAIPACGGDDDTTAVPFTLNVAPEFVQGVIPGAATGVLVTIANASPTDEPVEITASATGAQVTVEPAAIGEGEVAQVTLVADPVDDEIPIDIVVTGTRGTEEMSVTKSTSVFPWEDDRGTYATALLELFTGWLADNEPDLGITPGTEFTGSYVAPGLLVVSHYLFMAEQWEVGLAWHVMIAPDDWAEIYLRPRRELAPTLAFRLQSQAAALDENLIDIGPVPAPAEVVR